MATQFKNSQVISLNLLDETLSKITITDIMAQVTEAKKQYVILQENLERTSSDKVFALMCIKCSANLSSAAAFTPEEKKHYEALRKQNPDGKGGSTINIGNMAMAGHFLMLRRNNVHPKMKYEGEQGCTFNLWVLYPMAEKSSMITSMCFELEKLQFAFERSYDKVQAKTVNNDILRRLDITFQAIDKENKTDLVAFWEESKLLYKAGQTGCIIGSFDKDLKKKPVVVEKEFTRTKTVKGGMKRNAGFDL